jgi:hypothetical protein
MRLDIDEKVFRIHPGPALSLACSAKLFCEAVLRSCSARVAADQSFYGWFYSGS